MNLKLRLIFGLMVLVQAGCLSHKRVVPADQRLFPAQSATREQILTNLEERSKQVQTVQATILLDASGGGIKTGILTEYRQTKGFLVVQPPNNIRLKVQALLALATVADMVSDGRQYRVSIPVRNQFLVGDNDAPATAKNAFMNLRPRVLLAGLFVDIRPYLNNPQVKSILEEVEEGRRSFYVISFIDVAGPSAHLIEKLWIDRTDMQVGRKQIFQDDGKVATYVEYSDYSNESDIMFPRVVFIRRPVEDYAVKMTFQRVTMNEKLSADAFTLERPAGAELVQLETGDGSGPF